MSYRLMMVCLRYLYHSLSVFHIQVHAVWRLLYLYMYMEFMDALGVQLQMNSCSQLDSVDTSISSISFYRCLIFSSYQNFILGTGLFKKALSDPPPPPPKYLGNQPSSFATDFKWILLHDFTLLNLGDGRHFEMIFSERLTFF